MSRLRSEWRALLRWALTLAALGFLVAAGFVVGTALGLLAAGLSFGLLAVNATAAELQAERSRP